MYPPLTPAEFALRMEHLEALSERLQDEPSAAAQMVGELLGTVLFAYQRSLSAGSPDPLESLLDVASEWLLATPTGNGAKLRDRLWAEYLEWLAG